MQFTFFDIVVLGWAQATSLSDGANLNERLACAGIIYCLVATYNSPTYLTRAICLQFSRSKVDKVHVNGVGAALFWIAIVCLQR